MKKLWDMLKATAADWSEDDASRLAAALAYYTLLSLAPLVVLSVAIAGLVFGEEAARGQIASEISATVGPQAAQAIQEVVANARTPAAGTLGTFVGMVALLFGASGVFGELQSALDRIWEVKPKPNLGIKGLIRARFFSFTMVLGVAFLLLVSLVLSTAVAAAGDFLARTLPGGEALWHVLNLLLSFAVVTLVFALVFKVVPDVKIAWRDVAVGAVVTALLFTLGKYLLGLYLGRSSMDSAYGAAGSIVVFVVWVYYAAQILFFGAEFTQVWARTRGSRITPSEHAVPVDENARGERPRDPHTGRERPSPA